MILQGRYRPTELRKELQQTQASHLRTLRLQWAAGLAFSALLVAGVLAGIFVYQSESMTFILGFCAIVFWVFVGVGPLQRQRRAGEKIQFAIDLVDQLFPELHPARKVTAHLDLGKYDASAKQTWSGVSKHGNSKYRYRDLWLRLKFALVDGSEIVIRRKGDVKVRKGSIQKEKRCLILKFRPNPRTFGTTEQMDGFEGLLRQRIAEGFHDAPEAIKVKQRAGEPQIRVQVDQWDAPILATEAFMILEAIVLFLRMRG